MVSKKCCFTRVDGLSCTTLIFYNLMKKIFTILLLFLTIEPILSQINTTMVIKRESSLVINGSTNISKFRLTLEGKDFPGPEYNFNTKIDGDKITLSKSKISLDVKKFHSPNILALNGFLDLIKAKEFPFLDIELKDITLYNISPDKDMDQNKTKSVPHIRGVASVKITLTGQTRSYEIPFKAFQNKNEMSGEGSIRLTIKDFGLTPPVAMLGLVKISEWIEISINFSLLFSYSTQKLSDK